MKKAGTRSYNKRREPVTDEELKRVLNRIQMGKRLRDHQPEQGQCIFYSGGLVLRYAHVCFAEYYGRLNKAGDMGPLHTIILSSEGKVYQLIDDATFFELIWQTDKNVSNTPYGTIRLIGEGLNYQCSILNAFMTELGLYL